MADEGVHEIQLNGKQLVFLFMSATVVAVVIFLSGVMVGRGVAPAQAAAAADPADAPVDPTAAIETSAPVASATDRQPVSTQEELTYAARLEGKTPPPEALKARRAEGEEPLVREHAPAIADAAAATEPAADPSLAPPARNGWAVQVGAYPRTTAEGIARGLAARGFPAFILPRDRGLFAVRVGTYPNRRDADAMRLRLERDEQFKNPWVTR
jgi:cell division protein FtsN